MRKVIKYNLAFDFVPIHEGCKERTKEYMFQCKSRKEWINNLIGDNLEYDE